MLVQALVSGAGGFIGRALVARLQEQGHDVVRVVRRPPQDHEVFLDIERRRLDASRLAPSGLEGIDAVFHLAGEPIVPRRLSPARRERIRASRALTTDIVARALSSLEHPPKVLVSASAIGIYGDRGDTVLDEDSPAGEGFLAEVCRAWEAATGPAQASGIRVVHARTGIVLGNGGGLLAAQLPWFRLGLGARLGSGRQWTSWIALRDEVDALIHLATHEELSGACNLVAPQAATNAEFTRALGEVLGRPARLWVPALVLRIALGRETADELVLASQRVVPKRLSSTGFGFTAPDLSTALRLALDKAVDRRAL